MRKKFRVAPSAFRKNLNGWAVLLALACFSPHAFGKEFAAFPVASIVKIPPNSGTPQQYLSFKDLPCSHLDEKIIFELITFIAENNELILGWNEDFLRNLGAQIDHVHPLRFLGVIFSNPRLKKCMPKIIDCTLALKKTHFMNGLSRKLEREIERNRVDQYISEFSAEVSVPFEEIKKYFDNQRWEEMVRFLMEYGI